MKTTKYNRTFHLPWSPGATSDDKIAKNLNGIIGKEIVITEKLDGSNAGICNDGVYDRSHGDFSVAPWSRKIRDFHNVHIRGRLPIGTFIFCENLEAIHSIEYNELTDYFFMIGVRTNETWLSWDEVEEYSFLFDIPTVPILFRGYVKNETDLRNLIDDLVKGPSIYGNIKEGVVVRTVESFNDKDFSTNVLKWVRENHVTTDVHWTKNFKYAKLKDEKK